MSVSTFSGSDSGDGNYLNILSPPLNVIENSQTLYSIIQSNVSASETNDITRDPGAAIRDALINLSSPDEEDILYLVSRRYVEGGPTVEEIDMIDGMEEVGAGTAEGGYTWAVIVRADGVLADGTDDVCEIMQEAINRAWRIARGFLTDKAGRG